MDLTPAEETLTVLLGDDDTLPFAVTDAAGAAANISGATFAFRVLPSEYSPDADALISLTGGAGITITNAAGGLGEVTVTAQDKTALTVGTYWYRLHMGESNGTDTTLQRGSYKVVG